MIETDFKRIRVLGVLMARRTKGGRRVLFENLKFIIDEKVYTIPAGFTTDYSSVPTALSWFVDWRKVDLAGVVHDYLYTNKILSRKNADKAWRQIASQGKYHVNRVQGGLGYLALRAFGWIYWS